MGAPEANTTLIYGLHIRESANDGSDFSNGATDYRVLFLGEDGLLHVKDSSGTVTNPFTGAGAVATDAIWDAAGDLAVGTGANTAAKLTLGASGTYLRSTGSAAAWSAVDQGGFTYITKSADQDVVNAQNTDDSDLQFAVTSTKHYIVEGYFLTSGDNTSGDFEWRVAVSAGTMDGRGNSITVAADLSATSIASFAVVAAANSSNVTVGTNAAADLGFPGVSQLRFAFRQNTSSGTFKIQFGNNATGSGRTSRMMAGSYIRYRQTD